MGIPGNRFRIFWGAFFVVLPDLNGLTVVFFILLAFFCPNLHLIQHLVFNFFGEDFSVDDWLLVVDDSSSPYMLLPERGYCCRVGESTICHLLLRYLAAQSVRTWRFPGFFCCPMPAVGLVIIPPVSWLGMSVWGWESTTPLPPPPPPRTPLCGRLV